MRKPIPATRLDRRVCSSFMSPRPRFLTVVQFCRSDQRHPAAATPLAFARRAYAKSIHLAPWCGPAWCDAATAELLQPKAIAAAPAAEMPTPEQEPLSGASVQRPRALALRMASAAVAVCPHYHASWNGLDVQEFMGL